MSDKEFRETIKNAKKGKKLSGAYEMPGVGHYLRLLLNIGLTMVFSISICFAIGLMLVKKLNFPVIVIIILTAVGVGIGFYKVYVEITKLEEPK